MVLGFVKRLSGINLARAKFRVNPIGCLQQRALSNTKVFSGHDTTLPVLIVGAGPVGLVLSVLLTKLGVKCAVLEKNACFSKHPRAHFINNRSMEVFRKLEGLAEEIEKSQPPVDLWRRFIYCTSLCGKILGSVDHIQPEDFDKVVSPVSVAHFSQHKLTNVLFKKLEKLGFNVRTQEKAGGVTLDATNGSEILMGHECVHVQSSDQCVTATVSCVKNGKKSRKDIQCSFLVGADGAGSTIRKLAGIEMSGEKDLQKLVSIHFSSKELGKSLLNDRPGMLYFVFNTDAIGVFVAHDLQQGEFVLQVPFYPPQQIFADFSLETCKVLINKLVGRELSDLDMIDIKPWTMHAEVAEKFTCCDNRIILAGDAAHRFPPAGGFGMNTGIQDAHNLAWKIAALVKGIAQPSILNSYETERRPIALFNTALSVKNFRAAMEVPAALGLDPTIANSVHRIINNTVGSILPSGLQKTILDGIFSIGRAQVSEVVLNQNNPLGSMRLSRLKSIFEEGKSLQLQFPAEDLGFRYLDGALVPDKGDVTGELGIPSGRRRNYTPCVDPGYRLPHIFARVLSNSTDEKVISTLDLVFGVNLEFLLIITPAEELYNLARASFEVAEEFGTNVKVCVLWPADSNIGLNTESKSKLAPWENHVDVMEVRRHGSSSSGWSLFKMIERGAVLVRPDEHIAWRLKSGAVTEPVMEMRKVFSAILGKR